MQRDFHHYQKNFRSLLQAFSYPGTLVDVIDVSQGNSLSSFIYSQSILESLVDGEVTFQTWPKEVSLEEELKIFTNVQVIDDLAKVDYLWLDGEKLSEEVHLSFLEDVKIGELEDPEKSTTLIIAVADLIKGGEAFHLSGPGIKGVQEKSLPLSDSFLNWREEKNAEFPLGIDIIMVDTQGKALAIPRTTMIKKGE